MPRETVETPNTLAFLSILNEDGELDEKLEPDLGEDVLLRMHRAMLLARRFDQRMLSLQRQGRIGTFAPVTGQEASQVGSVAALEQEDWVVPSYREIAVNVWRGLPLEGMLLYNAGYNEGGAIPEEQNMLPPAVPVGTQMLHGAGIAYALRLRGEDRVVMTYFGDGATSEGDFHEALNFASVFRCPVVFVCQNNQYAISVPREKQTRSRTLAQKAFAYDMACVQVDGNDPLAVYAASAEAVRRAREEHEPTLVECVTYRLEVHTTVDDPSQYRSEEEEQRWAERDPLPRFQAYLEEKGLLADDALEELEEEVEQQIEAGVERWLERAEELRDPAAMFDHVYAEPPPHLVEQREGFERAWRERASQERPEVEHEKGGGVARRAEDEAADEESRRGQGDGEAEDDG